MSRRTVTGGRAARVVQEVRGRKGLVLHIHDDEWAAHAVKRPACCAAGRIAEPDGSSKRREVVECQRLSAVSVGRVSGCWVLSAECCEDALC